MYARTWVCPVSGGVENFRFIEEELPDPGPNDVLISHKAIGINFMDIYFRSGLYPNPGGRLGAEAAGFVERVGSQVTGFKPGDRVAYGKSSNGAYTDLRIVDSRTLVRLPDEVGFAEAAGSLLKGMTAAMLLTQLRPVGPGDRVLVHAAAGGVGLLLGQWLRSIRALSIGVVGNAGKAETARRAGFTHVLDRQSDDVLARIMDITGGQGVDVVYDGVGRDTFDCSFAALATRGTLVSFGAASGPVPPFAIASLAPKSLCVCRPTVSAYTRTPEELAALAAPVLEMLRTGVLSVSPARYGFDRLPDAHRDLEQRRTTGSVVIEL